MSQLFPFDQDRFMMHHNVLIRQLGQWQCQ